jgi:hypothetical protein
MQTVLLAAALLLGAGDPDAVPPVPAGPDAVVDATPGAFPAESSDAFYAGTARPYVPSITVFYPRPEYDCYSHNHKRLDCYPGFCESNYRRPYNYRVKFDYPWHEDVYRNWPDAIVCEDAMESPMVASSRAMYSGVRRDATLAKERPKSNAKTARTALGDAPLTRAKTLR